MPSACVYVVLHWNYFWRFLNINILRATLVISKPLQTQARRWHNIGSAMDTIASNNWDRTPPKVPILGSDDINSSPYTEKAEDASLYESYLHSKSSTLTGKLDSLTRLRRWLMSFSRPDGLPFSDDVLMEMILEDYPRRSDVLVDVMDFSPTRSERTQQKLQDVSTCKLVLTQHVAYTDFLPSGLHKPQWSTVRWMLVSPALYPCLYFSLRLKGHERS